MLYLFISLTFLNSCNSSDDNSSDLDPIIGKWQLQSLQENGQEESTPCSRQTVLTFLENGTTTINNFYDGDAAGNERCESANGTSIWENLGNSSYKVQDHGETTAIHFSENNTVFSVSASETYNGTTYTIAITYKKQ